MSTGIDSTDTAGATVRRVERAPGLTRLWRAIERRAITWAARRTLFNPWFKSPTGVAFVRDMYLRAAHATHHSRATRRATWRFFVTQPLFMIPFKRWRFHRRYGFSMPCFLALSPTRRCNLACQGCFGGGAAADELSFDEVSRIVGEAHNMGICLVVLIGGEPFCWPPLFRLLEQYPTVTFGIYTNGTLMTPAIAARLAALGNAQIGFSLEGFEATTDRRRGAGVFKKVLAGMDACRDAGVHIAYSVTVTRDNSDEVTSDAFIDLMLAHGCTDGWYYQYMPVGCGPDLALLPTAEQREQRRQRFVELRRTKAINLFDFVNDGELAGGCICGGRFYVHINAAGDVEPCAFYPFAASNIRNSSLLQALQSPFFRAIREHQHKATNPFAPCPIIDHPTRLREAVRTGGAYPTQPTAGQLLEELSGPLDAQAAQYRAHADAAWQRTTTPATDASTRE